MLFVHFPEIGVNTKHEQATSQTSFPAVPGLSIFSGPAGAFLTGFMLAGLVCERDCLLAFSGTSNTSGSNTI